MLLIAKIKSLAMMLWYPIGAIKPEGKPAVVRLTEVLGQLSAVLVLVYSSLIIALAV